MPVQCAITTELQTAGIWLCWLYCTHTHAVMALMTKPIQDQAPGLCMQICISRCLRLNALKHSNAPLHSSLMHVHVRRYQQYQLQRPGLLQ